MPQDLSGALAALLDRSLELITDTAADPRRFDGALIHQSADVWDNNLLPLFRVACTKGAWRRERRARVALRWMGAFGASRRQWMLEQAAVAGYDLAPLLAGLGFDTPLPYRDHLGRVHPARQALSTQSIADVRADYELEAAVVRRLAVNRAGTRMNASLRFAVPRRFTADGEADEALLSVHLAEVSAVRFDYDDTRGVVLGADGVRWGASGRVTAPDARLSIDDRQWHLSAAGRQVAATAPSLDDCLAELRRVPELRGVPLRWDAYTAARLLHCAMLELRAARHLRAPGGTSAAELSRVFAGAGTEIMAAGARHRGGAFRDLVRSWAERGGPALRPWIADTLRTFTHSADLVPAAERPRAPEDDRPDRAVLVSASWDAASHTRTYAQPARTAVQLAVPPLLGAADWRLRRVARDGCATFHLRTRALTDEGPLALADHSLDLHDGALVVSYGAA
ncbi:hypothetical protein [Streptacidiphilus rugosus]|uniref:hypothetical protein n=1 Tax=Streptacidiphilus rugosus TaxID=405783 RepID=UPI00056B0EAD|nr:hypothetical protein [Streptacidiphilus rugosus]